MVAGRAASSDASTIVGPPGTSPGSVRTSARATAAATAATAPPRASLRRRRRGAPRARGAGTAVGVDARPEREGRRDLAGGGAHRVPRPALLVDQRAQLG